MVPVPYHTTIWYHTAPTITTAMFDAIANCNLSVYNVLVYCHASVPYSKVIKTIRIKSI
jgi:hypothetical protein